MCGLKHYTSNEKLKLGVVPRTEVQLGMLLTVMLTRIVQTGCLVYDLMQSWHFRWNCLTTNFITIWSNHFQEIERKIYSCYGIPIGLFWLFKLIYFQKLIIHAVRISLLSKEKLDHHISQIITPVLWIAATLSLQKKEQIYHFISWCLILNSKNIVNMTTFRSVFWCIWYFNDI